MRTFFSDSPYANPPSDIHTLVELPDAYGQPLLLMPLAAAERRRLPRRIVLVCLRDTRGKVFLQQRAETVSHHPGLWDMSIVGNVMAGESFEGAALRELEQSLGIRGVSVKASASLPYSGSDGVSLSATFFLAGPTGIKPNLNAATVRDGMFVDADELRGFLEYQPDMLTPELSWAARSGWIFPYRHL